MMSGRGGASPGCRKSAMEGLTSPVQRGFSDWTFVSPVLSPSPILSRSFRFLLTFTYERVALARTSETTKAITAHWGRVLQRRMQFLHSHRSQFINGQSRPQMHARRREDRETRGCMPSRTCFVLPPCTEMFEDQERERERERKCQEYFFAKCSRRVFRSHS